MIIKRKTKAEEDAFRSGSVRSKYFLRPGNAQPDRKYINAYKKFLQASFTASLKKQLKVFGKVYHRVGSVPGKKNSPAYVTSKKHIGWCTGNLQNKTTSDVRIVTEFRPELGKLFIDYFLTPIHPEYGYEVAKERKPHPIPTDVLVKWLLKKSANGALHIKLPEVSVTSKTKQASRARVSKAQLVGRIAFLISQRAKYNSRPPVVKDWDNINKNKKLRLDFEKKVRTQGGKYRTAIRLSLIKNLNATDGNK